MCSSAFIIVFFFQAEDGIRDLVRSRGLGDVYKRQVEMAKINALIQDKQRLIGANEVRYAERFAEGCDLLVVAFGSAARIAQTAIRQAREAGLNVGLFRPISLYPFPSERLAALAARTRKILVFELNAGQMLEDVRLATGSSVPIEFFGRMGGVMPLSLLHISEPTRPY